VARYRSRFEHEGVPKVRMNPETLFTSREEMLAHAHYLLDGVEEYARDSKRKGKTGRHLGSIQTLLWVAGWYTLAEIMEHNKPDDSTSAPKSV